MAKADGVVVDEYKDWGVSGRRADRREYVRLKADIESGRVTAVYVFNLSRLGRSLSELTTFAALAQKHGVKLRSSKEHIDTSSATGRLVFNVLSSIAQFHAEVTQEALLAAVERRVARKDKLGQAGWGRKLDRDGERVIEVRDPGVDVQPLLDAFDEAGSVTGACKVLNTRGIPSPRGVEWSPASVRAVIDRERPGLLAQTAHERRRNVGAPMITTGLLICHCGQRMTPNPARARAYCLRARQTTGHGMASLTEAHILAWVHAEAARLLIPHSKVEERVDVSGQIAKAEAERERILDLYQSGDIDRDEKTARLLAVKGRLAELQARAMLAEHALPRAFDPTLDPAAQNAILRAMWSAIRLDEHLRPVGVDWIDPSWRDDQISTGLEAA